MSGLTLDLSMRGYADAVATLAAWARKETSGARVAAQVLLGTYNGYAFHMDLTDLCVLDGENRAVALTVIAGRAALGLEPHKVLVDGGKVFDALWRQWEHLGVERRYAKHYGAEVRHAG